MDDPVKEGLKQKLTFNNRTPHGVEMDDPVKEGLKLAQFKDIIIFAGKVEVDDPVKEGLKRCYLEAGKWVHQNKFDCFVG